MITVRLKIDRGYLTIVYYYAPEGNEAKTELFYDELQKNVDGMIKSDHLSGYLNARIGQR